MQTQAQLDATNHAAEMTTRQLERRCAKVAEKASRFLTSAYAVIEADLPYFLELRQRLNAQGQRGIEGWQRWCEKHFSCDVRTVNRALSSLLGPEKEKERTKTLRLRPALEAFGFAFEPAIELARKHSKDPASAELLNALGVEELRAFVPTDKLPQSTTGSGLNVEDEPVKLKKSDYYLVTFGADYSQRVVAKYGGIPSPKSGTHHFNYRQTFLIWIEAEDVSRRVIREATLAEVKQELRWDLRREMLDAKVYSRDLSDREDPLSKPENLKKVIDYLKELEKSPKLCPMVQDSYKWKTETLESLYSTPEELGGLVTQPNALQDSLSRSGSNVVEEAPPAWDDPFKADKEADIFNRETSIPLPILADQLMRVADELRAAWGLDGFADAIDAIAEKVEDREELNRRKQALDVKMSDGRPRSADALIRHARRDRRFQEDMRLILRAGGTTYRGKKIMAANSEPFIQRYTRREIIAEFKGDLANQLGIAKLELLEEEGA